jgi:hypothetical protein
MSTILSKGSCYGISNDHFIIEKQLPKTQIKNTVRETPNMPVKKINKDKTPVIVDDEDPDPMEDNAVHVKEYIL